MKKYIKNIKLNSTQIDDKNLSNLIFPNNKTKLVIGYLSPNLDFYKISKQIKSYFSSDVKIILASSAGELCNIDKKQKNLYLETDSDWDTVVLQSFSSDMISSVEVFTVPLKNEDLLKNENLKTTFQRVQEISQEIEKLDIPRDIDFRDTFAFTMIDGVSNSESFFIEAIYKTGVLPCNVVGGSAGGKLDFQETFIFDNSKVVQNSAVVSLIKLKENMKFGIFKSHNFLKTKHSCLAIEADPAKRYVKTIKRQNSSETENIVDYLIKIFNCKESELEAKFNKFAFGIVAGGESFIRSVSSIDFEKRVVYFYCDIDFGDELYLYRTNDFIKQTEDDFNEFLKDKPSKPIAGLLNDCVLRRLSNPNQLENLKTFSGIPLIGLSTFGELLGVNINQTLTAIFFFKVKKGEQFKDSYVDYFVHKYASYQNFFRDRELNQLKSKELKASYDALNGLNKELKNKVLELENSKEQLAQSAKMASLGTMVAGVAHEINTPVGMALTGTTHLYDEVKELENLFTNAKMTENDFTDFLENSMTLSKSIQINLAKAANLVKSFKQVAVDRSSDEDREFLLKEYVEEVLFSLHNEIKKFKHKIVVDIHEDIKVTLNPGALSQIITNFVMNSIIHAFDKDEVGELKLSAFVDNGKLYFIYKDNGKGLTKEVKEKIFDPFFTTNRANGGSGLGMNIVYNLITTKLDGKVEVVSEIGNGAKFKIIIDGCIKLSEEKELFLEHV
jgi:signal transduction histidine kinase